MKMFLMLLLIYNSWMDIKNKEIPLLPNVIAGCTGIINCLVNEAEGLILVVPGILFGVVIWIIAIGTDEAIGKGDALLFIVLGSWLKGWRSLYLFAWASVAAGIYSGYLWTIKRVRASRELPFIPFVALAYVGIVVV